MKPVSILIRLGLAVLLPLVLSCSKAKRWMGITDTRSAAPPTTVVCPPSSQVVSQAQSLAAAGAYQEAIDTFQGAYREQSRDRQLEGAYIDSLEMMATKADLAFQGQDLVKAGKIYAVLEKNYERFLSFEKDLSFRRTELTDKLAVCKKALFTSGFQAYRSGNLDRAIALWQDLLVIDPQNASIQHALQTARTQKKTLQGVE